VQLRGVGSVQMPEGGLGFLYSAGNPSGSSYKSSSRISFLQHYHGQIGPHVPCWSCRFYQVCRPTPSRKAHLSIFPTGENSPLVEAQDCAATARQFIHALNAQSNAASATGRAARCSDNLRLDFSSQEALSLRSKCACSEDRQTDGLCVCRSIPSQF